MRQTIRQLLQTAYREINSLDADLLLSFVIGKPREYLFTHETDSIENTFQRKFKALVKKRKLDVPFAYLTGHKEFCGLDFLVDKNTLIPRPDTELLVEEVIKYLKKFENSEKSLPLLIDIGTGSGCIPIAIIKNNQIAASLDTVAIDISPRALEIAKKNANKHKIKIKFHQGNLLSPILKLKNNFENIIITANLPYLTEEQYKSEKSIKYEPKKALVAKKEGLALYEKLLEQIKIISEKNNLSPAIFMEIDPSQSMAANALILQILPNRKIKIKKDLAGQDRLIIIT